MQKNAIEIIAMIDYHYFAIKLVQDKLNERKPKDAISAMVDRATGHDTAITLEAAELIEHSIGEIIKYKKLLNEQFGQDHDISHDENHLSGISEFIQKVKFDKK